MKPAHEPTVGCPACGHVLTPLRVADVTIDACRGGCEGIWFDAAELLRFDEQHEPFLPARRIALYRPGVSNPQRTGRRSRDVHTVVVDGGGGPSILDRLSRSDGK